MPQHIILLCDTIERPFLAASLTASVPDIEIHHIDDAAGLMALDATLLAKSRLIAFCSGVIVPVEILKKIGRGAYNFHPGPPTYPGWMPVAFAIYDDATEFGATALIISDDADEGTIAGVEMFAVQSGISRLELAKESYLAVLRLFRRLAPQLAGDASLPSIAGTWKPRRTSRAMFAALCDIPHDIDAQELDRRLRAFGDGDGFSSPTIWLHNVPFRAAQANEPE